MGVCPSSGVCSYKLESPLPCDCWILAIGLSADALTREPPKCAVRVCSVPGPSDGQKLVGVLHAVGKIQMGKTFSSTAMVDSVKTGAEVLKNCKDLCSSR